MDLLLENEAKGLILRAKCISYEQGEKSTQYFLNLEKKNATKGVIRSLIDENGVEHSESKDILTNIRGFYKTLFTKDSSEDMVSCVNFLNPLLIPILNENDRILCDVEITIDDLYESLCSMQNNKTPGNDGLSKELYIQFWDKLSTFLFQSLMQGKRKGELSASQKQAVFKLLEKRVETKDI